MNNNMSLLEDMRKHGKTIAKLGTVPYKEDMKCPRVTHNITLNIQHQKCCTHSLETVKPK